MGIFIGFGQKSNIIESQAKNESSYNSIILLNK